ncbi:GNAT family N-acetyltransferase [Shewanella psychropiezotolerans]|uniref:GNAT family N-acetyltransferase n=1 Tax=Shewanella psychropiezotolerans TaxID=2593655 RepID=A0ABX5X4N2_9GAMM|nr:MULTISPECIES: GNAT family N-acetyltransferase [Shewanella]MPY25727.1 GNAT family N-acetyltransferase [Shewanella sp. YLB-07]QDO86307.1 GNAT family N-acetyltransferase [Shewanella psychropiezotolerans]
MSLKIVEVTPEVDSLVCAIIKRVGEEYGAVGEGYGPSDAEVENMSQHYSNINSLYLVAKLNGKVVGGCGVAPFNKSSDICELKKLFLLKESRGHGLGKSLTIKCLEYAKQQGYQQCYLDTLSNMDSAIRLYEKLGFEHLSESLSGTVHNACDVWMLKTL